jgi:hypothetical protein
VARRAQRIELVPREPLQPDRLRRLDERTPVREQEEARLDRPPERVGRRRVPPLAADGAEDRVRGPLPAVAHGELVALAASAPHAGGESRRRLGRAQRALEAVRRGEDAPHTAVATVSGP